MGQLPLELGHRTALDRDHFLVAPCNEAAVAWLDRWPAWPAFAFAIHGPAGCGKTHLAHVWRARSRAAILSPAALERTRVAETVGAATAMILDGIGPGETRVDEIALLHLYNLAAEQGRHLLICSRTAPARWPIGIADLASRLGAVPAVAVEAPDDALLQAVLVKQFADRQLKVAGDVVAYLTTHMERSFAAAGEIVAAIDRAALAGRRRITLQLARDTLRQGGMYNAGD